MSERKTLTITKVEEVKKVGEKQIPKLSFKAKDGDKELTYFTFKSSLFDLIKEGQTINADVETSTREWDEQTYTDRRIVQIYVDGQPVNVKGGYRGKSPEELELSAKSYALAYAKDLAVAQVIPLKEITDQAEIFYNWLKGNGNKPASPATPAQEHQKDSGAEDLIKSPTGIKDITEFKGLMSDYKLGTHDVCEALSINKLTDIKDWDKAWADLKKAKGIEP